MGKNYIITEKELLLLAATVGIKKIYGFDMRADPVKREEGIYILNELVQKGYMTCDGRFAPIDEMKRIFSVMGEAETVLEVHKKSGRTCLIYIDEISVRVSVSLRRKDCFEISELPLEEVWGWLQEEGWVMRENEE